jgi:NitT/TauT family transport system ATP-binding protein
MEMSYKIELNNLSFAYWIKNNGVKTKFTALDHFSLDIAEGEFVTVLGPSGCGKSTLLDILSGLVKPDAGSYKIDGEIVRGPALDRGFVMQSYALFPWRTVRKNIEYGLEVKRISRKERSQLAAKYLDLVGLSGFADRYPYELSGGMKQRAAIARSLVYDPSILLMDEPFAAVDAQTRESLQDELIGIWRKTKKTIIFVTHSIDEAVILANKIVVMTGNPGTVKKILCVDLPYPRNTPKIKGSSAYADISGEIWGLLNNQDASLASAAL